MPSDDKEHARPQHGNLEQDENNRKPVHDLEHVPANKKPCSSGLPRRQSNAPSYVGNSGMNMGHYARPRQAPAIHCCRFGRSPLRKAVLAVPSSRT
jgi:hypothetical protein